MSQGTLIGHILAELGVVDEATRAQAAAQQPARPTRFASRLLALGAATEGALVRGLAHQKGVPGVDLSQTVIDLSALEAVPRQVAEDSLFLALARDGEHLYVALANPDDRALLDELQFITGCRVVPHVALQGALREAIPKAYAAADAGETLWPGGEGLDLAGGAHVATVTPGGDDGVAIDDSPDAGEDELLSVTVELEGLGDDEVAPEPEPTPQRAPGGPRVLVVDDEEEIRNLLSTALLRAEYQVETAGRGLEALHKIKSFEPEVILLDAMLPEVHGFEICRKVRASKRFAHVPVVMISAVYRGWRYAQDLKEVYGATDFIEKPFRIPDVLKRVEDALKGADAAPPEAPAEARDRATRAYRRGVGMLKVGRIDGAIEAFREGIAADPFAAALHFSLGRAQQLKGEGYGAMASYERAVELKPDLFAALKRLAELYEQKGFRRKAIEAWERALPVAPDDAGKQLSRQSLLALLETP